MYGLGIFIRNCNILTIKEIQFIANNVFILACHICDALDRFMECGCFTDWYFSDCCAIEFIRSIYKFFNL